MDKAEDIECFCEKCMKVSVKDTKKFYFKCYKNFYTNKQGYICCSMQMRPVKRSTHIGWIEDFYSFITTEDLQRMFEGRELKHGKIYELDIINASRDWETGIVDNWDYDFILVKEDEFNDKKE